MTLGKFIISGPSIHVSKCGKHKNEDFSITNGVNMEIFNIEKEDYRYQIFFKNIIAYVICDIHHQLYPLYPILGIGPFII